jgi:enoyl-CoA hydratase
MTTRVSYDLTDGIATITMDDGKVNVLSLGMLAELNAAFDRGEADEAVVVLSGREGRFSAGFDLATLTTDPANAPVMLRAGFELSVRMLSFPFPVVVACTGHAIAMGSFLLLSGDYRVGADGPFKIRANEVAIGLTMPFAAIEVCRQRLTPAHFSRAVLNAEEYTPRGAVEAGFLDEVVDPGAVAATARTKAVELSQLNTAAHAGSKLRTREHALSAIRAGIEQDDESLRALIAQASG